MGRASKLLFLSLLAAVSFGVKNIYAYEEEVEISTLPIGSSFYRHLANDFNLDLKELVKFEKKGFGHTEIVTLVLISKSSGTVLKEYGKRRLKDQTLLKDFAAEAGLDYPTLYKSARAIKEGIEAKGDTLLPPPVYEATPLPAETPEKKSKKKKKDKTEKKPDGDNPN